jgi:hypothetical protein
MGHLKPVYGGAKSTWVGRQASYNQYPMAEDVCCWTVPFCICRWPKLLCDFYLKENSCICLWSIPNVEACKLAHIEVILKVTRHLGLPLPSCWVLSYPLKSPCIQNSAGDGRPLVTFSPTTFIQKNKIGEIEMLLPLL